MADEQEIEETHSEDIYNLTESLINLYEIDIALMDRFDQDKISHMKDRIINALYYFCENLPEMA